MATAACAVHQVHEVARGVAVGGVLEGDVEVGRGAQQEHQRPQREAAAAVLLHAEIDAHLLDPLGQCAGRDGVEVGGGEIAAELVVEVQALRHAAIAIVLQARKA